MCYVLRCTISLVPQLANAYTGVYMYLYLGPWNIKNKTV